MNCCKVDKVCIFCRVPKAHFKIEHVFPAALGGAFTIDNVCAECNEILGEKIDNPFCRHELILLNRHQYQIARKGFKGKRSIPNPLKSHRFRDSEGREHFVQFNKDGQAISQLIPQYQEPKPAEGGFIGTLTVPYEEGMDEEKAKVSYARKYGLDLSEVVITNRTISPITPLNIQILALNDSLILGMIKIAYEFTATVLPDYIMDPFSEIFTQVLLSGEVIESQKAHFVEDEVVKKDLLDRMMRFRDLKQFHNLILMATIPGKGLYCLVKVFNAAYLVKLSNIETYLKLEELVLFNDCVEQAWLMNVLATLNIFSIKTNLVNLNRTNKRIVERSKDGFKTSVGKIPVFNKKGVLLHKHMDELANNLLHPPQYDFVKKEIVKSIPFPPDTYFVKYFKKDLLVPIKHIDFIYSMSY